MDTEFWKERWRQNQIGFHQPDVNAYLRTHFDALGIDSGRRVFVPLCGKSRDMIWLHDQGYAVLGVEISPLAVEAFFREGGLEPRTLREEPFDVWKSGGIEILCGDFFHITPEQTRDIAAVYDRASLIALPPEMRRDYAVHMARLVAPDVPVLIVTMEYPQAAMQGPPFSVTAAEVHALYDGKFDVTALAQHDILEDNPRFRSAGLGSLTERVWLARRKPD